MTKYLFEGDMIMSEYQTKFPTTMSDFSENSLESSYKQKVLTNKINSDKEYIIDLINKYNIPSNDKLFGLLGNIDEFLNYDVITNSFGIDNFRLKSLLALIGELGLHIVDKNILIIILIRQINLLNLRSHNLNMFNFENDIDFVNDIYRSASFLLIDNYWLFLLYTSSLMNKDITCKKFGLSSDDFLKVENDQEILKVNLSKWESVICEITQVTKLKLYNNPADVLSDYLIGNDVPKIEYIQSYDGMEVMRIRQELKILVGSEDSFNKIIHLSNRLRIIEREKNILENTLGYVC